MNKARNPDNAKETASNIINAMDISCQCCNLNDLLPVLLSSILCRPLPHNANTDADNPYACTCQMNYILLFINTLTICFAEFLIGIELHEHFN